MTPPRRFRKRPVEVEAMPYGVATHALVVEWLISHDVWPGNQHMGPTLIIPTLEGSMVAREGDWIVRGIKGEFYPVKDAIFQATYEAVE